MVSSQHPSARLGQFQRSTLELEWLDPAKQKLARGVQTRQNRRRSGHERFSVNGKQSHQHLTLVAVVAAAPYPFALLAVGLGAAAGGSFPRAFGLEWSTDSGYEFPNGGVSFYLGLLVVFAGIGLVASLVRAVRGATLARWGVMAWLVAAVYVSYRVARRPDRSRRCFVDGYSDALICASARSVALRDFLLLATPAVVAIACLLFRTPPKDAHQSPLRRWFDQAWAQAWAGPDVWFGDDGDRPAEK